MPSFISAFFDQRMEPKEWAHAWDSLVKITGANDYAEEHHTTGEGWQYMGSEPVKQEDPAGRWCHCFRHRDHPKTGRREYIWIPATWEWTRRQIVATERARIAEAYAAGSTVARARYDADASRTDAQPATL
jgi:hypothetical protein